MRNLRSVFDRHVRQARFSVRRLFQDIEGDLAGIGGCGALVTALRRGVTAGEYQYLMQGIVRASYLIELVKQPQIETTKFEVRWAERLPNTDPRHASHEECNAIFKSLLEGLAKALSDEKAVALWRMLQQTKILPYEIPVDYEQRRVDSTIHARDNVIWLWGNTSVETAVALRKAITDPNIVGEEAGVFKEAVKKLRVKTYLTDRVLTGAHKTNREKRWEVHPGSVHFATRAQCLEIERELIEQVCYFDGFPVGIAERLVAEGVLKGRQTTRCPVTLEPLSYEAFVRELGEPLHGKSNFQVGHLHPLKADPSEPHSGHTALNVSWISADGNRIQGSYSLEETRALLHRIADRYGEVGWNAGD